MTDLAPTSLRSEVVGGLVSSAIAIPLAIGFGMFAFVALGDEYFAYGAIAGLLSAVIAGFVCVLLGDRSTMVYAPRITTTFFLGLLLYSLVHSDFAALNKPAPASILLVFFAIVLLGGVLQALFGLLRLGTLIKFTPHPVMAGFQNMAALLLFLVQLGNVLGYDHNVSFRQVYLYLSSAEPLSLLVAALTFAAMWHARRITTKIPPLLIGLGFGTAAYYGLVLMGLSAQLGPTIGPLTASAAMRSVLVDFSAFTMEGTLLKAAPAIASGALALAIIASIDALLCARLAGQPGEIRTDGDRLLVRLGLANTVSGAFGGITSGINIGPSVTNRAFGGRSWLSVIVNALMLLLAATVLFRLVTYLPRAVLSALIMVVAIQHIDPWTKQAAAAVLSRDTPQRSAVALDLGVALFVSLLSIVVNIVIAVFLGIVLAVLLFVVRMSRSSVRRLYRCDRVRSRKSRGAAAMAALEAKGSAILVIELQGALFFGSAERLAQIVARETASATGVAVRKFAGDLSALGSELPNQSDTRKPMRLVSLLNPKFATVPAEQSRELRIRDTSAVLLDLRRVTDVDSTGARILGDIDQALAAQNIRLALIYAERAAAPGLAGAFSARDRVFPDVDRAIEWAEDGLLGTAAAPDAAGEIPIEQVSILRDFTPDEFAVLKRHLERVNWPAGQVIFRQGDPGTALFLLTSGRGSVHIGNADGAIRLVTFVPGTVFGELAILDRGPRSATLTADEDMVAFALSVDTFDTLRAAQPAVAIKLLAALGRELSVRLRSANLTIQQLEI